MKSMLEATGTTTVPTRTFRAAGVHTWVLTAETVPKLTRFTVDANGETYEILLQQVLPSSYPTKGQGKGKQKSKAANTHNTEQAASTWQPPYSIPAPKPHADDEGIGKLEARFDKLEQRQTAFEGRVESKFDHISDSLRQILAASHTRGREVTGETPPSKFPKQS